MATKLEMIILIKPNGEIELKTVGMKGAECDEELKPLEKELGFSKKTYTAEKHEKPLVEKSKGKLGKKK